METTFEALLQKVYTVHDLEKALGVLVWDRETNMPPKGLPARIQQMTTLRRLQHEMFTSAEMGDLIAAASAEATDAAADSFAYTLLRYLRRHYADQRKLPPEFVRRMTEAGARGHEAWVQARENNDFAHFQPYLELNVSMCAEMADYFGYEDEQYDALLDKYEHGMKTAEVRALFNAAKEALVPLREEVDARADSIDDSIVHQHYPIAQQKRFARYIATAVGYDFSRGHLGTVVHPFATSFSKDDARITTRWYDNFLNPSLFGTLHESGHAMYEQGTDAELARTPLARGTSSGIHESQSRMIENIVGRSRGFWRRHYPKLQEMFPAQLEGHGVETFYRAINKVQPSNIRVEADEMTYNFHIILRFELEQALLSGDLAVAELPAAWNDKMKELLGVVPPTDTLGCLQDVHWSRPGFGYFPTYALGNLYAAQMYETAVARQPQIAVDMAAGEPASLVAWLRQEVHRHGRKYPPGELIVRATGKPLSHEPFARYITAKFSDLYGLT